MPNPAPTTAVLDAVLATSTNVTRRLEIYEYDGVTLWGGPGLGSRLVDGTISVDYARDERRTIDCVLDNSDGALRHDPFNGLWYDKVIKVWRGIKYYTIDPIGGAIIQSTYEAQLGEFLIDRLDGDNFPNLIKVTGRDFTKKMLISKLSQTMSFPAGTPVEDMIRALAANCGITKFMLATTGKTVDSNTVFERGEDRWKVAKKLAEAAVHELFFDATGYLVLRPFLDPTTSPIEYTFETGTNGNLVKFNKSSTDARVFNHITVTGDSTAEPQLDGSQGIIFAEAKNTSGDSPTRIARIGQRTQPIDNVFFANQTQANEFVNARLKIAALEEFNYNFDSLVVPWMDAGSIVALLDPNRTEYEPTRFLLDTISIPLKLAPMSGVARRVTIVGALGT